jgi:hypothetical protein
MERINGTRFLVFTKRNATLLLGLMAGCVAPQITRIPQPVGPTAVVPSATNVGRLVVHTEAMCAGDDVSYRHQPYTVLDVSGRVLKKITNSSGEESVPVDAGRYLVRAESYVRRVVVVEVQIVNGRTTEVHLDGRWKPESSESQSIVFGPDGAPVGYQAAREQVPNKKR